ncbi:MAG: hypothetical protein H7A35_10670 [Planctomycetales bacterium]|nr:hypothetical protein [bacterium]UNM07332.1 MAG: hypothetical protein H7A35_10670 [Planctomycetales bacterium]
MIRHADGYEVRFPLVDEAGSFTHIPLDEGLGIATENWSGDDGLIHLSVVHEGELHVGACACPGSVRRDVRLDISIAPARSRRTSDAPSGDINKLIDLQATGLGNGEYALHWSEVNRGDYDFNGEANISDIVGIARSLEQSYDQADPEAPLLTEFWVDGNQDGTVTVADISVIGQNYGSQVAGYAISINDTLLDPDADGLTLTRGESNPRIGLPNTYSIEYTGTINDNVTVVPRNVELVDGVSTNPVVSSQYNLHMNIDMQLPETEFYDLDGSGNSGPFGEGRYAVSMLDIDQLEPLRRILPGEIPSSAEIGNTLLTGNGAEVYDLPLNRPVAVALAFLPTRDLASETLIDPPDGSPIDSFWDLEPVVNVYMLPDGAQLEQQSFSFNLQVSKVNEFKVIGLTTFTGIDGLLGHPLVQEYDDGFLSRNTEDFSTDFPGAFEDDVRLQDGKPDQEPWGISSNLLRRRYLETRSLAFNKANYQMMAKIDILDSINTEEGYVVARVQSLSLDGVPVPELELPVDSVFLKFTELSEFRKATLNPEQFIQISPSQLVQEQIIFVQGRLHREGSIEGFDIYWIDELTVPLI